jgi:ATP-binding cassette subfamily F protein 3
MSLLIAEHICHSFGPEDVLKNISFRLSETDRIGLIGPNGEGKSTLMKIIGGFLESTLGEIQRKQGLSVGYLPQTPPALDGGTIYDAMLAVFTDVRQLETELHTAAAQLAQNGDDPDELKRYGDLQHQFECLGGYDYPHRIEQVLTGLGFEQSMWHQSLATLSGGQRTRTYLATLLLKEPELLLLDEPTNHLDLDSIEWLEEYLKSFKGAILVVSHDRYFLDHVTQYTWEISFGGLETYHGAYSHYLQQREIRQKERTRQWEEQQEFIEKTRDFIARHLAGQRTKEAQGRRTRLERFLRDEAIEKPREHETMHIHLQSRGRTGDIVLRAEDLTVGYDVAKPLATLNNLEILRGQRIAIVGPNGTGKTTLMRTILGELKPLSGAVRLGSNVKVGYISQTHHEMDPEMTAIETVMAMKKNCLEEEARNVLGSLLLSGDDVFKKISKLSGGQRSRVAIARLMMREINVLALDEPTNHLDIPSTQLIQEVLQQFDGTVIFVSHDRYLVQAVATHIWAIDKGAVRCVPGNWETYLAWREKRKSEQALADALPDKAKEERVQDYREARKQANQLQKLRRRYEQLEADIEKNEKALAKLNESISSAGQHGHIDEVTQLGEEYERTSVFLQKLYKEWEDLAETLESDSTTTDQ